MNNNLSHHPPALSSDRFFPLSQVRKLRECEQVAAVCYRLRNAAAEFLLVQTRGGRWTFPKGGVEPGLTHAQAAALEAFEEAGVHGRIEDAPFAQYVRPRPEKLRRGASRKQKDLTVNAYLCEVLRLGRIHESDRNRTWFSPQTAKLNLREGRNSLYGAELARVIDRAVQRIRGVSATTAEAFTTAVRPAVPDALQKVQFEAPSSDIHAGPSRRSAFAGYSRRRIYSSPAIELAAHTQTCQILQFASPRPAGNIAPPGKLLTGTVHVDSTSLKGSQSRTGGRVVAKPRDSAAGRRKGQNLEKVRADNQT